MKISVVIPSLNEGGCIGDVIKRIPKDIVDEVLVVDGHSSDNTVDVARNIGVKVLTQPGTGLGDAYRFGAKNISGDIMIILDADGSHVPEDIPKLVKKIKEGYDLVIASRLSGGNRSEEMPIYSFRYVANRAVSLSCKLLFGIKISDPWMGFRAIKRDVMLGLKTTSLGQEIDIEMLIRTSKTGHKIGEIKTYEPKRQYGKSKFNTFFEGSRLSILFVRELLNLGVGPKPFFLQNIVFWIQQKLTWKKK